MRRSFTRLLASRVAQKTESEVLDAIERLVPALPKPSYLTSPICGRQLSGYVPSSEQREVVRKRFLPAVVRSYSDLLRRGTHQSPKSERMSHSNGGFESSGLSEFALPQRRFEVIQHLLSPTFDALVSSVKEKRNNRQPLKFPDYVKDLDPKSDPFREIQNLLVECGVFAVVNSREARPVRLAQVALQFSDHERTLSEYGSIDSDGLPLQKSSYWHIDSSTTIRTKLLIYMNDVESDHGPFMYIPGSHSSSSVVELAVRKTNDHLRLSPKEFIALPDHFQLHALFGEHMVPDDPLIGSLLAAEISVTGKAGTAILFDLDGIHRGGFVRVGERRMLQCNFSVDY